MTVQAHLSINSQFIEQISTFIAGAPSISLDHRLTFSDSSTDKFLNVWSQRLSLQAGNPLQFDMAALPVPNLTTNFDLFTNQEIRYCSLQHISGVGVAQINFTQLSEPVKVINLQPTQIEVLLIAAGSVFVSNPDEFTITPLNGDLELDMILASDNIAK